MLRVYDTEGNIIKDADNLNLKKLIKRNEAVWVDKNKIKLLKDINNIDKRGHINKKVRQEVFEKEEYTCYICGCKTEKNDNVIGNKTSTIDHVISINNGGKDTIDNLHCCCRRCNLDKKNMDITEYYNQIVKNRTKYNYISNKQLKKIQEECMRVLKENPRITGIIDIDDNGKNVQIYVNNKKMINISEVDDIEKVAVKIYELLKSLNSNYILDIIN